jgi:hypothetical protein
VSFDEMTAVERIALIDRHLAAITPEDDANRFTAATGTAIGRMRYALVDDDLTDEQFAARLAEWNEHLATLSEPEAASARYELQAFVQILDGLRGPEEDEPAA